MNYYPYFEKWISDHGIRSDTELARIFDLNKSTIRKIRNGEREDCIQMSTIRKILKVTGLPFEVCFAKEVFKK